MKRSSRIAPAMLVCAPVVLATNGVMAAGSGANGSESDKISGYGAKGSHVPVGPGAGAGSGKVRVTVQLKGLTAADYTRTHGKKYSDVPHETRRALRRRAAGEQNAALRDIKSSGVPFAVKEKFDTVINGFSGETNSKNISAIENARSVKRVYISNHYRRAASQASGETPDDASSNGMVKAPQVWKNLGYQGQGMKVAVIDKGVDVKHKDLVLKGSAKPALDKTKVNNLIRKKDMSGKYYTKKVPYGYNYADHNDVVKDKGKGATEHGMHVAGTVGANGDENHGGVKGVAPEAQLLAMKVFSNDQESSTSSDIYVKAIDDAVKLHADAINMSFGSKASFAAKGDPAQVALDKATKAGVLTSHSAGNGYYFGHGHKDPYVSNPDTGVISTPKLTSGAIEVGNFENESLSLPAFKYSDGGDGEEQELAFKPASKAPDPDKLGRKKRSVNYVGKGRVPGDSDDHPDADDYKDRNIGSNDLKGKIALVKRGESNYVEKTLNAQKHGASGVVVVNNKDDGYHNMHSNSDVKIPQVFVTKEDGEKIVKALEDDDVNIELALKRGRVKKPSPEAGKMAKSSSWGPTSDLNFRPGISAPGQNILSTLNNDSYGVKGGTSMAAPHVAGGAALVMERLDKKFGFTGSKRYVMAKNMLMNGAVSRDAPSAAGGDSHEESLPYSPRRQGAGLMNLKNSLNTPVVVTEKNSGEGKAALKEVGDTKRFRLTMRNLSKNKVSYTVNAGAQTDQSDGKKNKRKPVRLEDKSTGKAPIDVHAKGGVGTKEGYRVTVPAKGSTQVDVTLHLDHAVDGKLKKSVEELFPNGGFVDGFVRFTDRSGDDPDLSVPYSGFYGDWNKAPVVDQLPQDDKESFYDESRMMTDKGSDSHSELSTDPVDGKPVKNHFAISPNGDGTQDSIFPRLSFLRNAKKVQFKVLDSDKKSLATLKKKKKVKKNYKGSSSHPYKTFDHAKWDGRVGGSTVKDGRYYYEIESRLDYAGAKWQKKRIPVRVDMTKPKMRASYNADSGRISWRSRDPRGSGVAFYQVLVDGKDVSGRLDAGKTTYTLKGSDKEDKKVKVRATDWAGNQKVVDL